MPELPQKQILRLKIKPLTIFNDSLQYILSKYMFFIFILFFNFAYLWLFENIDSGISNPLSILWFGGYYIFWCVFYRYYYSLRPYFFFKAITSSLKPSTQAVVILFLVMTIVAILPMLPLFLGYNNVYLDFYENYVRSIEELSDKSVEAASWKSVLWVYGLFSLAAPFLICRPYMAWIASLCRRNISFSEAGYRMRGNYWNLVLIIVILLIPEIMVIYAEKNKILMQYSVLGINSAIIIYANVVFAKIYDFFWMKE
ncbi:MAG: hypothetical protein IJ099_02505 [Alphaproteobacteria bacterium]|nr:hypothetical protein [Alphaproteobacteria bacterium]